MKGNPYSAVWRANAGSYNLMLGDSSANIQQRITIQYRS